MRRLTLVWPVTRPRPDERAAKVVALRAFREARKDRSTQRPDPPKAA